jgi:hypothetical protein
MKYYLTSLICIYTLCSFSQPKQFEDKSYKNIEYIKQGFPSTDRTWIAVDYEKASQILEGVKIKNKLELPRKYSPNSSEIFNKICDLSNLNFFDNQSAQFRISEISRIIQSIQVFSKIYEIEGSKEFKGHGFSSEITDILIMTCRLSEKMLLVVNEFIAPNIDKLTENQKKGYKLVQNGLREVVFGLFTTLQQEHSYYQKKDTILLANTLSDFLPQTLRFLSENDMIEIKNRTDEMIRNHPYLEVRESLKDFKNKINTPTSTNKK